MSEIVERTEADEMRELAEYVAKRWDEQGSAFVLLRDAEGEDVFSMPADERAALQKARGALELDPLKVDDDASDGLEDCVDRIGAEDALEIYATGKKRGGEWDVDGVVIVTGTGGPHVQIEYDGRSALVRCYGWFRDGETTRELSDNAVALLERAFALDLMMDDEF